MKPRLLLLYAAFVGLLSAPAAEPDSYYLPSGDSSYNTTIPTPAQFFGFQIGEWHLRNDQIVAYLRELDRLSDRISVRDLGRSLEQRPLVVAFITSPDNQARLEQIRTQHLALLDPTAGPTASTAAMPVIVNQGFSIHGDEPSAANAVPLYAYHLAAANDPETTRFLNEAVVLLEPVRNPDGFDRFATWANANRGFTLVAHAANREHWEPWPRGRTNHYGFDPNRDWLPLVFPEARARAELFHAWRPNVLTDHHEMGTDRTFFFQPGVPSRSNPNTPAWIFDLTGRIAGYHAATLNEIGSLYYTKESFDDFYAGKGSTYPDLHGTVGILFEQASSRGQLQESDGDRPEISFPFTIRNQVRTAFSTLRAAVEMRADLLATMPRFTRETTELARKDAAQAWVFDDAGDPARGWRFRELLRLHQIRYHALTREVTVGERTYQTGNAWLVPVDQPQYRLLTEIFQPRTTFEDSVFYDVSAWTLPCAFGLAWDGLADVSARGALVTDDPFPAGRLVGQQGDYAYVMDWSALHAPRALQRFLDAGIAVRGFNDESIAMVDGQRVRLGRGAILIPLGLQPERRATIDALVARAVRQDAVTIHRVATGLASGGVDLGSPAVRRLESPRVLLVTGESVNRYDAAEVWHALDLHVGLGVVRTDLDVLSRLDFQDFTTIILVDGTYAAMKTEALEALKRWVNSGGTLIALGRAASWVVQQEIVSATIAEPKAGDGKPERRPYAGGRDHEALEEIAGAIFSTTIDLTHPLGYGLSRPELPLFRSNRLILQPAKSKYETPAVYTAAPLLSGYASDANIAAIANSAAIVAVTTGTGRAILMPDNPVFRGFWLVGERVLLNAIYFGPVIEPLEPASRRE